MELTDLANALRDELLDIFPPPEFEVLVDSVPSLDKGVDPLVQVYKHASFNYVSVYLMRMIHCKFAGDGGEEAAVNYDYHDPESVPKLIDSIRRHFRNARDSRRLSRRA